MSQIDVAGPIAAAADPLAALRKVGDERARSFAWSLPVTLGAGAVLTLIAAAAVGAWLATGAVVPWDSKNHFYAMYRFLGEALARGEIPLWNPFHFGGYPAVADPQSLIFTPTMFLFAAMFPHASMQGFDAMIFSHLLLGGFGVLGLFRRRGWHPAGAVLAASIFMLGGPAASRLQHTGMIISYGFIPVAFLLLEVALARCSMWAAVGFGVVAALMAVGRDQVAFLACLTLIALLVWQVAHDEAPLAYLRRRILLLIVMGVTGAALLVVPSVLTMQFLADSNRPGIAFGVAVAGSLAPVNFATLFAPNVFGSLNWTYDYWGPGYETMVDPDWTDRAINYVFIGTLPALLLVWHGFAGGRLFGRSFRFFLAIGLAALIYAVGRYTPVFAWIFDLVPGVKLYRRPADATFELNIALAFGSGYLLHRYLNEGLPNPLRRFARPISFTLVGGTIAGMAVLVGSALTFSQANGHVGAAVEAFAFAGALAILGALVLHLCRHPAHRPIAAGLLVLATAGELVWRDAAASINAEPASAYAVYSGLSPSQSAGLEILRKEIAARVDGGEHPRVEILGLGGAWQNASMALGLENTLGYNPLRIADYERAVGPGENAVDPNLRHYPGTFRGYRCALASLLGLEYLVIDRPLNRMPRHVPKPRATQIFAGDHMYIYRLGNVAPRAYLATSVHLVDREEALSEHVLPDFDRTREVLIDQTSQPDVKSQYEPSVSADSSVKIAAYHDDRVLLDVNTDKAGIVVLHDIWYPGWRVLVDGVEKPVLRANVLFRGVEVPAGHHVVSFEFHPLAPANLIAAARGILHGSDE
jgi:hypothetical protein